MYLTLVPAYGRDYKSKAEVQRDLDANKDFIIQSYGHPYDGKPANASSLRAEGVTTVNIRYKRLQAVGVFKVPSSQGLASNPTDQFFQSNPRDFGTAIVWGVGTILGAYVAMRLIWMSERR